MNVTELARKLKKTTTELLEILPEFGFDVGKKAIKVDNRLADKIIKDWPKMIKELEAKKAIAKKSAAEEGITPAAEAKKSVKIPSIITVRDFAAKIDQPVSLVLKNLMKNGIFVSMNERIDFDTASVIGDDFNVEIIPAEEENAQEITYEEKIKELLKEEKQEILKERPPVIVIMGHVDHGKTKLLDTIRKTDIVAGEAGGITQHIGAYQVEKNNRKITFIDTPGHEAFTAMRARGAKVADIAILIVAADDSVKPQTIEAYRIIEQSKIPFIVAINKIDKPEANIDKVKQDLSQQLNLTPEDWGGKTIMVPVSAMTGENVDELLDMILLVADIDKDKIKANPDKEAVGTIIESHIDKGEGPVATALIQAGTLNINDNICVNNTLYGKVRAMKEWRGENIENAGPATPVKIIGFKAAPQVGDIMEVVCEVKGLKKKIKTYAKEKPASVASIENTGEETEKIKKFNLILKTDVLGSQEAILESLEKIHHPDIQIKIVSKGLGNVTENDVLQAEATGAIIYGFSVLVPQPVQDLARDKEIEINSHKIIYELIDNVKKHLKELLGTETIITVLGQLEVLEIFRTEKNAMIVGGRVKTGKLEINSKIKVLRKNEEIAQGALDELKAGKEAVKEVVAGEQCGIKFTGQPVIARGDILEVYKEEEKAIKLD